MKHLIKRLILSITTVAAMNVASAEEGAIRLSNIAMKQVITVNEDGRSTISYVAPEKVVPGDVILYTIEFENISDKSASNIVIDDPVPNNSFYRDGSATGSNTRIQFSLDGKRFDSAENLTVLKNGQRQLAPAEQYAAIRWVYTAELKPGEKRSVSFKTQIKQPGE